MSAMYKTDRRYNFQPPAAHGHKVAAAMKRDGDLEESNLKHKLPRNGTLKVYDEYERSGKGIGGYLMGEILSALLWHCHLCSEQSVVDRLPNVDSDPSQKKKDKKGVLPGRGGGKLYFLDNVRLRSRRMKDLVMALKALDFDYDALCEGEMGSWFDVKSVEERYLLKSVDTSSDDGILEICRLIYDELLAEVLYQCAFRGTKDVYSNQVS